MRAPLALGSIALLLAAAVTAGCGGSTDSSLSGPSELADASDEADAAWGPDSSSQDDVLSQDVLPSDGSPEDAIGDTSAEDVEQDSSEQDVQQDSPLEPDGSSLCAPPADPSRASLCITVEPEPLDLVPADPALDGQGVLVVQVYDTATPDHPDGGQDQPLFSRIIPEQPSPSTPTVLMGIYSQMPEIRFDSLPNRVYVRAIFVDNMQAITAQDFALPGIWLGGLDLSQGLLRQSLLKAVPLTLGQANQLSIPLQALRKLQVTLKRRANTHPVGNGEGPARGLVLQGNQLNTQSKGFGLTSAACGDINSGSGITTVGVVLGTGNYYTLGWFDDFGLGFSQGPAGGSLINEQQISATGLTLPDSAKLTVPARAYSVTQAIDLNFVVPFQGPMPQDNTSCP